MKRLHVHRGSAVPNPLSQVDLDEGEEIKRSENSIKMSICCTLGFYTKSLRPLANTEWMWKSLAVQSLFLAVFTIVFQ